MIVTNLRELYTTDSRGRALQDIPMMQGIDSIQQMKLIVNVAAGYPGTKEERGALRRHAVSGPDSPRRRHHRRAGDDALPLHSEAASRLARRDQRRGGGREARDRQGRRTESHPNIPRRASPDGTAIRWGTF